MKSLDMKLRYGIAIITVLLFLLAVKSSFGQSLGNANDRHTDESAPQIIQNDPLVDPLSPQLLTAAKKDQTNKASNITYSNGRMVNVDTQGVQSLSISKTTSAAPEKSKSDMHRKE